MLTMIAAAAALVLLIAFTWQFLPPDFPTGPVVLSGLAVIVVAGVIAALTYTRHVIRALDVTGRLVTLNNVSPQFAEACRLQREEDKTAQEAKYDTNPTPRE
jgi:hypothetical protein